MSVDIKCPGGEIVHPVLSLNRADVQCRIQGGLRPAFDRTGHGTRPAVCCDDYFNCPIWRLHVEIDRGPSTKVQREHAVSTPHRHVL